MKNVIVLTIALLMAVALAPAQTANSATTDEQLTLETQAVMAMFIAIDVEVLRTGANPPATQPVDCTIEHGRAASCRLSLDPIIPSRPHLPPGGTASR